MASVSIIMASYQGEKYIDEQIASITASEFSDFKLYIYDDGSTDNTKECILKNINEYPDKIELIENNTNLGCTKNFLNGLIETVNTKEPSKYYMFSDQDDIWFPNKIGRMKKRMEKLEKIYGEKCPLMVFSDAKVVDDNLNIKYKSYHKSQGLNVKKRKLSSLLIENKCSGCMLMINASLAKKVKRVPKYARYHDWWLALIAAAFGRISYINAPTVLYRQHTSNAVGSKGFIRDCINKFFDADKAQKSIIECIKQAEAFLLEYETELSENNKEVVKAFANLRKKDYTRKRADILKYRFFKSRLIKDIGVLLYI